MSRTNLKSAAPAAQRSTSRRAIAWSAVLVPVVVAGVVWISSSAPAPAAQKAPAAGPTSPAPPQVVPPSTPAVPRTSGGQATPAAEPMTRAGRPIGLVVPEELQTFMVATRTPDGRIVLEHANGPKAAQAQAPRAGATKARKAAAKPAP